MQSGTSLLSRLAQRCCVWAERWFPDAFAFAVLMVGIVSVGALFYGVAPKVIVSNFGSGFWNLIPFTMQMSFVIIGGYVTADSPPVARLIQHIAAMPRSGRGAVTLVAFVAMLLSLVHWGLSMIFASLLVRALAGRSELRMDYRAAAAAAFLGAGSVWAMGLSSSAAQLQANPASMPASLLAITGVIPFSETIFIWQSYVVTVVLFVVSAWVAWTSAPGDQTAQTARQLGIAVGARDHALPARTRPGEWLEYSPLLNLLLVALGGAWLWNEFASKGAVLAISSLNTYNLIFIMLGLLLQWRPRRFLDAVGRGVPSIAGVLVQFPLYGAIAAILSTATNANGSTPSKFISEQLLRFTSTDSFAVVVGAYSAVLGLFLPSAGGKWLVEAPYVMQLANDLKYNLGWAVQIYNAAEALPNLINPFWMLPVLGVLGLKARDLIGYTFVQFIVHLPLVLFLLWILGRTLGYHAPVMPVAAP
jgi:short-chain fatty acids transporter